MATSNSEDQPRPLDRAFLTDDPDAGMLILVRHGQQVWPDQESSTVGDWVDPPLSKLGQQQAAAVGRYLADEPISAVYSSELQRANHTGRAIANHHGLAVETIAILEEIRLYGHLPSDVRPVDVLGQKIINRARERFTQTKRWDSYPQSETSDEFRRRIGIAVEAAIADHQGETVVVACHGGVINAYLANLLNTEEDMIYRPVHASVHRVRFKDSTRAIDSLNEQVFLRDQDLLSV